MLGGREAILFFITTPLYAILIGAEIVFSNWKQVKWYSLKETLQNVYLSLSNGLLDLALRSLFYMFVLSWFYTFHIATISNIYLYWLLLFIAEDFVFYIVHYIDHYSRFFWAVHLTHHSSPEFNLTTGFRSSVLQPVYRFIYFIPLALLGFKPIDIVFMYSLTQTYGILVHTQFIKKMPSWFEAVFVSPSHHRVHHASNIIYLDKNMGMCLIIWDKIFGTFQKEVPSVSIAYGLTKPIKNHHNFVNHIVYEWKNMYADVTSKKTSTINKLKYIFKAPGWSHDGSSKTAVQLRNELKLEA